MIRVNERIRTSKDNSWYLSESLPAERCEFEKDYHDEDIVALGKDLVVVEKDLVALGTWLPWRRTWLPKWCTTLM